MPQMMRVIFASQKKLNKNYSVFDPIPAHERLSHIAIKLESYIAIIFH